MIATPNSVKAQDTSSNDLNTSKLLFASSRNDIKGLQSLISNSADANSADYDGRTALHVSASKGHMEAVTYLISVGANINAIDRFGGKPRDDAVRNGHQLIAEVLISAGADTLSSKFELEMIHACSSGDVESVERLLLNKVSPNCKDYDGRTPLHLAASLRHVEILKLLIRNVDRFGGTPYDDAMRNKKRLGQDDVVEMLRKQDLRLKDSAHDLRTVSTTTSTREPFVILLVIFQVAMIVLHGLFSTYAADTADLDRYPMYQDVHVMIFVGFGFLMTFLRKFGYSSVGLTLLISAVVLQWNPLLQVFWHGVFSPDRGFEYVRFSIKTLIESDFGAAAVLITFGVLIGKVSPTQMLVISFIEPIFYNLNYQIALKMSVADVGGSMVIHAFGAVFGLAATRFLSTKKARSSGDNSASYHSDMFAMIGTIFLWMFWPSFNGALASGEAFNRAVVNTLMSLTGSCVMAFLFSYILRNDKKFCMVDIQNATLAGGVAIGSCADMPIGPAASLAIGSLAGTLSTFGFSRIQRRVEHHLGVHDTCGVLNLHGIPGVIAGLASSIATAALSFKTPVPSLAAIYPEIARGERSFSTQAEYQAVFLIITIVHASIAGSLVGILAKHCNPSTDYFVDSESWEVPELELPYYFDSRGEVEHSADNGHFANLEKRLIDLEGRSLVVDQNKDK